MTLCVLQLGLMCIIEIISYSSYGNIETRTVVLHRARRGFGFVLRGAKASSPLMELRPSERCPGLQYLDDVDAGGVADRAGLRKGDFLVAVSCYIILTIKPTSWRSSESRHKLWRAMLGFSLRDSIRKFIEKLIKKLKKNLCKVKWQWMSNMAQTTDYCWGR